MCTVPPQTEKSLGQRADVVGLDCPLCDGSTPVEYMKFLDPHGVERVDGQIFECRAKRHSFTWLNSGGVRLLAADGVRPSRPRVFRLDASGCRLAEAEAGAGVIARSS